MTHKGLQLPLWTIIPALMLFTLTYFIAFKNYSISEWLIGNGLMAIPIGLTYVGEFIFRREK